MYNEVKIKEFPIYMKLKNFTLKVFQQESIVSLFLINFEGSKR